MTATTPMRAQMTAADPTLSVWVAANAGTGKTKVLTDRVLRLLLAGTPRAHPVHHLYQSGSGRDGKPHPPHAQPMGGDGG